MNRPLDLILRLFCLGQLFTCVRPYFLRTLTQGFETGGMAGVGVALSEAWPAARWLVYGVCLAIVMLGAKRSLVAALAASQLLDVGYAIWTNTLASGYSEKGLLLLVSLGAAGLLVVDTGEVEARSARLRSFLRGAASIGFASIALNKINSDFLDPVTSCSRMLNEGLMRMVPLMEPLARLMSGHAWGALLMEALLLPLLLVFPRLGVLYAWVFFVNVAMVGPRATCFVFMALALVFLPPADWARLRVRSRPVLVGLAFCVVVSTGFWVVALDEARRFHLTQLLTRVSFLSLGLLGIALLGLNLWRARDPVGRGPSPFRGAPRIAQIVAASVLALLVLNELSPHLGLKSKYSLTMWSNLRADRGRANSYVFPEILRVSGRVDHALLMVSAVRVRDGGDARIGQSATRSRPVWPPFVAMHGTALAHLRQLEAKHGTVRFNLSHVDRKYTFEGTGVDSEFARFIESTRPGVDWFEDAVMSVEAPQRCLGP